MFKDKFLLIVMAGLLFPASASLLDKFFGLEEQQEMLTETTEKIANELDQQGMILSVYHSKMGDYLGTDTVQIDTYTIQRTWSDGTEDGAAKPHYKGWERYDTHIPLDSGSTYYMALKEGEVIDSIYVYREVYSGDTVYRTKPVQIINMTRSIRRLEPIDSLKSLERIYIED